MMKGMMGLILVLTRRFITHNSKKDIMKSHKSSSKNTLILYFLCELCSVGKHQMNKQINQIMFCFNTVKSWRDSPINTIWLLEEAGGKSISTSRVIR